MRATSFLNESSVLLKLSAVRDDCRGALQNVIDPASVPKLPGRDLEVRSIQKMPPRLPMANREGQQKLVHDLANIELQAMELGFRTLLEFPDAPLAFRLELQKIILEESRHLGMCLENLRMLGGRWGSWPVHLGLWNTVSPEDTLLERVFIVHRYLESSGLDAGELILKRLAGAPNLGVRQLVKTIVDDEVGHVEFGSRWYRYFCEKETVDEAQFFKDMTRQLLRQNPRPGKISEKLRRKAGYTEEELQVLQDAKQEAARR